MEKEVINARSLMANAIECENGFETVERSVLNMTMKSKR
jgi:hypothetical protein